MLSLFTRIDWQQCDFLQSEFLDAARYLRNIVFGRQQECALGQFASLFVQVTALRRQQQLKTVARFRLHINFDRSSGKQFKSQLLFNLAVQAAQMPALRAC